LHHFIVLVEFKDFEEVSTARVYIETCDVLYIETL